MTNSSDYKNCQCRFYTQESEVVQILILVVTHTQTLQNWRLHVLNLHIVAYCLDKIAKVLHATPQSQVA